MFIVHLCQAVLRQCSDWLQDDGASVSAEFFCEMGVEHSLLDYLSILKP
jgi:hypothetical protein